MATNEICPTCEEKIVLKPVGEDLLSFNLDGTLHRCWRKPEPKPIGQAIKGKTILDFHLKKRRATLMLSDNLALEISASSDNDLVAMNLTLVTPDKVFEEKG